MSQPRVDQPTDAANQTATPPVQEESPVVITAPAPESTPPAETPDTAPPPETTPEPADEYVAPAENGNQEEAPPTMWQKFVRHTYLQAGMGYGAMNAGNGDGLDHNGLRWGFGAGYKDNFGPKDRFQYRVGAFVDHQHLEMGLTPEGADQKELSAVNALGVGAEGYIGYRILPGWLNAGLGLVLGGSRYSANPGPENQFGFESEGGLLWDEHAARFPMSDWGGRLGLLAQINGVRDLLFVRGGYNYDPGINPTVSITDPEGEVTLPFNGNQLYVMAGVNLMPLLDFGDGGFYKSFKGKASANAEVEQPSTYGDDAAEVAPPPATGSAAPATGPATGPGVEEAPAPAMTPEQIMSAITSELESFTGYLAVAKSSTTDADRQRGYYDAEARRGRSAESETLAFHSEEAIKAAKNILAQKNSAEQALGSLDELISQAPEENQAELRSRLEDEQKKMSEFDKAYKDAYDDAKKTHDKYKNHRRKNDGAPEVSFDLEKPAKTRPANRQDTTKPKPKPTPPAEKPAEKEDKDSGFEFD